MKNKRLYIFFVVVVILFICTLTIIGQKKNEPTSPVRAQVGSITITQKDVEYEMGVERAYGNTTITPELALLVLMNNAREQEVARSVGVLPNREDITSFKEYVNSSTKAPEMLQFVKDVFGTDIDSYDRIYLLPKIVNISLHSFFSNNKEINKESLIKINKAYAEIKEGGNFADVAKNNMLQYSTHTIGLRSNMLASAVQDYATISEMSKSKVHIAAETLKPGEINKAIIEDDYSYSIIRLLSSKNDEYKIENIVSKKSDYDSWYAKEAKEVSVKLRK